MKVSEIKAKMVSMIEREAYRATVYGELRALGFEAGYMEYSETTSNGKAFGAMQLYSTLTGAASDPIYEKAVEAARKDITGADYDIVKLLDMAGHNGKEYYESVMKMA